MGSSRPNQKKIKFQRTKLGIFERKMEKEKTNEKEGKEWTVK